MVSEFEAYKLAKQTVQKITEEKIKKGWNIDYRLATSGGVSLQLPGGWRFPFDVLLNETRWQGKLIILFVEQDPNKEPEIEWADEIPGEVNTWAYQEQKLPPLSEVENFLQKQFPKEIKIQIETSERVVTFLDESKIQLGWRIRYRRLGKNKEFFERDSIMVYLAPDGKIKKKEPKLQSRGIVQPWDIGRSQYRPHLGNLTINLKHLLKNNTLLPTQWLIWSCMAHAVERLTQLEFHRINPYNIRIEFTGNKPECCRSDNIPVIQFPIEDDWNDPTVVCHELGHAIWEFLFTRPPSSIDTTSNEEYAGIQEGFADYFAATLAVGDKHSDSVEIGGGLPDTTIKRNSFKHELPRLIDGKRYDIPVTNSGEKKYEFGRKWANVLWDFRRQVGPKTADEVIFLAHFKPRVFIEPRPLAAYFHSLMNTAFYLNIDNFKNWSQLAKTHDLDIEI